MSNQHDDANISQRDGENEAMAEIVQRPLKSRLAAYAKRSGPGWLQGAITLGGGSLASALYLGTIAGDSMMWLQPMAMILGVIMLSAIAFVTLTSGQRPFRLINQHISPVLGWAWVIATLLANMVWCMPQFALGSAAVQQNLLPMLNTPSGGVLVCGALFAVSLMINFFYESGNRGIRLFEGILKLMVAVVVLSFFGVVVAMTVGGGLDWSSVLGGLVPDFSLLTRPAEGFASAIAATGSFADYWSAKITADQRDIMIAAFGNAVGINMTFLLPYSMLNKGWGKNHRGLAIFDLSTGLIIPFVLATSCVVIAASAQFHAKGGDVLDATGKPKPGMETAFYQVVDARLAAEAGGAGELGKWTPEQLAARREALPLADKELAAMLVQRDNFQLANALEPLTGPRIAQWVFGIGVLGMAFSTIIILMLINGFVLCEIFNQPGNRVLHMTGAALAGIGGSAGLFFLWSDSQAKAALAVPTSVFGGAMIPIAYFTFLLLMNSDRVLGEARPRGVAALRWNALMLVATGVATAATIWVLASKGTAGKVGIAVLVALFVLGAAGFRKKGRQHAAG
ncbi:MAG: divalent metal cation transporter [Verrucomicrobiales bacterium]|nr:divalent metal cation transporter [Verrucomicrobiales bacterium]